MPRHTSQTLLAATPQQAQASADRRDRTVPVMTWFPRPTDRLPSRLRQAYRIKPYGYMPWLVERG